MATIVNSCITQRLEWWNSPSIFQLGFRTFRTMTYAGWKPVHELSWPIRTRHHVEDVGLTFGHWMIDVNMWRFSTRWKQKIYTSLWFLLSSRFCVIGWARYKDATRMRFWRILRTLRFVSMLVLSVVSHGDGDYFPTVLLFMIYNESSGLWIRFDSQPL